MDILVKKQLWMLKDWPSLDARRQPLRWYCDCRRSDPSSPSSFSTLCNCPPETHRLPPNSSCPLKIGMMQLWYFDVSVLVVRLLNTSLDPDRVTSIIPSGKELRKFSSFTQAINTKVYQRGRRGVYWILAPRAVIWIGVIWRNINKIHYLDYHIIFH